MSSDELFKMPFSIDLRDMEVVEALRYVSAKTGINIVASSQVLGRVTMILEDVPMKDIFDLILRLNNLAYVKKGEVYQVMTQDEYRALYGKMFADTRKVKVLRLKYAVPEQVFSMLDALKSELGRVLVDQESGNVLLMDTPAQIRVMEDALVSFEKKNLVEVFTLKYAEAKDVEDILKSRLDARKVGFVKADERNNQIIVQTFSERMREVRSLIEKLDTPTKQVLIDTRIIKIRLSDQLDSGLEWEGIFKLSNSYGTQYLGSTPVSVLTSGDSTPTFQTRKDFYQAQNEQIGLYPFSGTTASLSSSSRKTVGEALHFGVFRDNQDFDMLYTLLTTLGESRVLANPKMVVINNREAKIHIGERQAYVTTTTTSGQTTSTIAEEVSFVDVGIQLSVTPAINDDGFVTMKIKPEISNVGSVLVTPTNNRIPIIDTTLTETTVMMKDGVTLLIGGLRKEEKTLDDERFPFLSDIPILGQAFRSGTDKTERTEILITITPTIISGETFTTAEPGEFTGSGNKPAVPYEEFVPGQEVLPGNIPSSVFPKSYQEYPDLGGAGGGSGFLAKGKKDENKEGVVE
ncbi:MAG: hypothetical protein MJA29_05760, partial [Candidatus Omnitrophica bacterium]|nr:hypothetical protein [Candidatus Omnitrophota bacterium]